MDIRHFNDHRQAPQPIQGFREQALKSRLKSIYKEADEEHADLFAGLLLATYRKETQDKFLIAMITLVTSIVVQAVLFLIFFG